MKRLLMMTLVIGGAAIAMAFGTFTKVFDDTYKISKDSKLGKAACSSCHVGVKGGKLNPYGLALQREMKAEKTKKLTPAIMKKVEAEDSDGDGTKNIDEIKGDRNPGLKG